MLSLTRLYSRFANGQRKQESLRGREICRKMISRIHSRDFTVDLQRGIIYEESFERTRESDEILMRESTQIRRKRLAEILRDR